MTTTGGLQQAVSFNCYTLPMLGSGDTNVSYFDEKGDLLRGRPRIEADTGNSFIDSPREAPQPEVRRVSEIIRGIQGTEYLREDWDSFGSGPASKKAVSVAQDLVWTVLSEMYGVGRERAIPFSAAPLSGNGVQLEWRGSRWAVEVEVGPDGRLGYLLASEEGRRGEEGDDASKEAILRLIRKVLE